MADLLYRVCTKCKVSYPQNLTFFYARKRFRAGLSSICRKCESDMSRKWRENNREKANKAVRDWNKRNPERVKEIYRKNNKKRSTGTAAIRNRISCAIKWHLKNSGTSKGGIKWEPVLGWNAADLIRHLERQFHDGMNWDNYGKWHVDHILPISSFKINSMLDPEFKACWALSNLRPLWASDNIRKKHYRTLLL